MSVKSEIAERIFGRFVRRAPQTDPLIDEAIRTTAQGAARQSTTPLATGAAQAATPPGMRQLAAERTAQRLARTAGQPSRTSRAGGAALSQFQGSWPRRLTGLGLLGGAGYMGYQALRPSDEEAQAQALGLLRSQLETPEQLQQRAYEAYVTPFQRPVETVDPQLQALLEQQFGPLRQELSGMGGRAARATEQGYADYAARAAAEAAALQALAERTSGAVAGAGEAGAAGVEDVLYGGGMDVSGTSGLAPVAGYLADQPGMIRDAGDAAAQAALRNLSLDAEGFAREADLMSQMGPAYSRQLADQIALQDIQLQGLANQALLEDYLGRRATQQELENLALQQFAGLQAETELAEVQDRANAVRIAETLAATNPERIERYFADWRDRDEERYTAIGLDFVDYIAQREAERNAPQG